MGKGMEGCVTLKGIAPLGTAGLRLARGSLPHLLRVPLMDMTPAVTQTGAAGALLQIRDEGGGQWSSAPGLEARWLWE